MNDDTWVGWDYSGATFGQLTGGRNPLVGPGFVVVDIDRNEYLIGDVNLGGSDCACCPSKVLDRDTIITYYRRVRMPGDPG